MTVAGCQSCGKTVDANSQGGFFGQPAGPCPSCGRLMLWMTEQDGLDLRDGRDASGGLVEAVDRAREARFALRGRPAPSSSLRRSSV